MKTLKKSKNCHRVQITVGHTPDGRRIRKSFTAKTEWEAIKLAEEYRQNKGVCDVEDMTVTGALNQYIEAKSNILSPSTIRGYKIIRDTRLQLINNIYIRELKTKDIQNAVNYDAKRLSRKSIVLALGLLKSALDYQEVEISTKKITIPQKIPKDIDLPDIGTIINIIKDTELELPCLLAMWLSLRVSEVRGLKFKDISPDGKFISIRRSRMYLDGKDVIREKNKTVKSTRKNRLPVYIYDLIQKVPHNSDEDFIVQMGYNQIRANFKKLFKANGLGDMKFHSLRHVFATTLNELGIPDEYIQKLGGWSNNKVMKEVYTHTRKSKEDEFQNQIDDYFMNFIK